MKGLILYQNPQFQTEALKNTYFSVSANVGSYKDPEGLNGLSHLLEHCLLGTGSMKYPKPNDFS